MSGAARQRERYRRLRQGRACLVVEVSVVDLTEALIVAKLLTTADPTREQLTHAVEELLAVFSHA